MVDRSASGPLAALSANPYIIGMNQSDNIRFDEAPVAPPSSLGRVAEPNGSSETDQTAPLLSVVVPTRNRQECAFSLILGLHQSASPDFELIIQDNSEDDRLGTLVAGLNDPRMHYLHTTEILNMHQNWDQAIPRARGHYICLLGDDDGVIIERAIELLKEAKGADADAVLSGIASFSWPGLRHWLWGDWSGILIDFEPARAGRCMLDPRQERARVFAQGVTAGLGRMPRVYQGFVSRRCLNELYAACGTHFPGGSPDMANAVALCAFVNKILLAPDRVALLSGHSPKSGGGAGSAGLHHGRLEDQAHLPAGTVENWDPALPRFWSGVTIYAQSAVAAARATTPSEMPPLAYHRLYAACLVYERRRYWRDVLAAMRHSDRSQALLFARVGLSALRAGIVRFATLGKNIVSYRLRVGSHPRFPDIAAVMAAFRSGTVKESLEKVLKGIWSCMFHSGWISTEDLKTAASRRC